MYGYVYYLVISYVREECLKNVHLCVCVRARFCACHLVSPPLSTYTHTHIWSMSLSYSSFLVNLSHISGAAKGRLRSNSHTTEQWMGFTGPCDVTEWHWQKCKKLQRNTSANASCDALVVDVNSVTEQLGIASIEHLASLHESAEDSYPETGCPWNCYVSSSSRTISAVHFIIWQKREQRVILDGLCNLFCAVFFVLIRSYKALNGSEWQW